MNYNFDRIVDRKSTNDVKWHSNVVSAYLGGVPVPEEMIPMWIADTEFACTPEIINKIKTRADKEIFGYCGPMNDFYDSVIYWQKSRFNWDVEKSWIGVIPTVVAGINIAIRTFTQEGDGVIIQQPVYDPFSKIVKNANRTVVNNAIVCKDGQYEINFAQLEEFAKQPENKLMVLCSPHNPMGIVWSAEDLRKIADICLANNVMLVSDEIHADIVFSGNHHCPLLSLEKRYADNFILLSSPSKTFNIAGLKTAMSIIPNEEIRAAFNKTQVALSLDIKNTFGLEAVVAAYTPEGNEWVSQQLAYMESNIKFVQKFIAQNMPGVSMIAPQGTFLCWLDLSGLNLGDDEILKRLLFKAAVICVPGSWFGKGGEEHLRLNIGCPQSILKEALERIAKALYN